MAAQSPLDHVAYVQALELAPTHQVVASLSAKGALRAAAETPKEGPSAAVDAGSLMAFTATVSPQHRSDALNSTLLAQLNSDKLYDRFDPKQTMNWYRNYQTVLSNIGWDMQAFDFEEYRASGSTMSVSTAVLTVLGALLPAGELALVAAALKALSSLKSDDPWYRVWDVSTQDKGKASCQIAECVDADGAVNTMALRVSCYALNTSETTVRFLWNEYHNTAADLQYAKQEATLDEDVYSQVRPTIVKKLGDKAVQYVGNLDI